MADLCHIFSACLLLYRVAPASMRRRSFMMNASRLGRLFARPPEDISPDAARSAAAHLDQVSGSATAESGASLVPWLRGVASIAGRAQLCSTAGIQTRTSTRRSRLRRGVSG